MVTVWIRARIQANVYGSRRRYREPILTTDAERAKCPPADTEILLHVYAPQGKRTVETYAQVQPIISTDQSKLCFEIAEDSCNTTIEKPAWMNHLLMYCPSPLH